MKRMDDDTRTVEFEAERGEGNHNPARDAETSLREDQRSNPVVQRALLRVAKGSGQASGHNKHASHASHSTHATGWLSPKP